MSDISSRPTGSSGSAESAGSRSNQLSQIKSKSERENLEETSPIIELGRLKLRGKTDDLPQYVFVYACSLDGLHCAN
jgi:hypothetical protein